MRALAPVVNSLFDVPSMARLAVGPAWDTLTPAQQQQLTEAFGRYVSATYADRFDSYSGEQLQVLANFLMAAASSSRPRSCESASIR